MNMFDKYVTVNSISNFRNKRVNISKTELRKYINIKLSMKVQ